MSAVVITKLERDCIACPTSWIATTESGEELYIRYRWGDLTVKTRSDDREELYRQDLGGAFDGHMTVYELRKVLTKDKFEFDVEYPKTFYGFLAQECTFDIMGSWIATVTCDECDWETDQEDLEKLEYETVLPPKCPECKGTLTVNTETPEHMKELQEKAEEIDESDVIDNLKDNFSEE